MLRPYLILFECKSREKSLNLQMFLIKVIICSVLIHFFSMCLFAAKVEDPAETNKH